MTSRERELAAIRHECPDRIPVDAICIENVPQIAEFLGVGEDEVYPRLGIDGRLVCPAYTGECSVAPDRTPLGPFGVIDIAVTYASWLWHPLGEAATVRDVENHHWPDAGSWDCEEAGRIARELGDDYAVRGPYWMPLFSQTCSLFGMEEAMVKMTLEPALFEAAIERVTDIVCGVCERLLDECGDSMPILCLGDDFATQRGLMVSPDQWRRFVKPQTARTFEVAKSRGKHVWYHSCGDITSVLPDLIDIGMDVWETVQLHTLPISAEDLKREYGAHIAFFGGINTQHLPFASPSEVRDEVSRCVEVLGRGGGYICGPDHHIKPDVPAENAVALFDAATGFRSPEHTC